MNVDIVFATSSIMLMLRRINLDGSVSTFSACNHFSSSAFSESIKTTNIPCSCACLTTLPDAINDLPEPDSPANTVTLPSGTPL